MHISPWFAGRKEKSMKYLNKVVEIILEVLVAGMVLGCCWQVITRFVLHNPSKYTEELLRYMLIWLTMMGVPYAYCNRCAYYDFKCFSNDYWWNYGYC